MVKLPTDEQNGFVAITTAQEQANKLVAVTTPKCMQTQLLRKTIIFNHYNNQLVTRIERTVTTT